MGKKSSRQIFPNFSRMDFQEKRKSLENFVFSFLFFQNFIQGKHSFWELFIKKKSQNKEK